MQAQDKTASSPLLALWLPLRKVFYANIFFSFVINLLMLVPSLYMLQVYDRVISSRNGYTLLFLTAITLLLLGLMAALEWVRSSLLIRVGGRLEEEFSTQVFDAAFRSNLRAGVGDVRQAIGDVASLRQFLTSGRFQCFLDAPWAPIYIIFCFMMHPVLGWFAIMSSILLVILALLTERMTHKAMAEAAMAGTLATRYAGSQMQNCEVIEAMGMLQPLRERWFGKHAKMLALQAQTGEVSGAMSAITRMVRVSVQSLGLGLGAYLVLSDGLSPGVMFAISILVSRALAPIEGVIGNLQGLEAAKQAYVRLNTLLRLMPPAVSQISFPRPLGNVRVEGLFGAPPNRREAVLKGMTFNIPAGATVVVAGPSGSGKSTLVRLLVGIWPSIRGSVRLDGVDVFEWNKAELGQWIGYLPQDVELLEGSVAENIARFGVLDSEKVIAAANLAGVHELILSLPNGYDTELGAGASVLSGGQKQRIALARALYGAPALIVLDEPNSNLDDAGELALLAAIKRLKEAGTTVVVVSHRRNILSIADLLMLVKDGQVAAYGPPQELQKALALKQQQKTPGANGN